MAAARCEIIGADHAGAALDLSPPAHVIGGGEIGHTAFVVIAGEPCKAAHLAKTAAIEQQVDPFAARELAPAALADDPGVQRARRKAGVGDPLQG